jgi:hypothetical protein
MWRSPKRRTCDPFPRRGPAAPGAAGPYARLPAGPSRLPGTPSIWWRAGRCSALADFVNRRRHRGEECKHLRGLREEHGFSAGMPARDSAIPMPSSVSQLSLPRFLIIDIPGGSP